MDGFVGVVIPPCTGYKLQVSMGECRFVSSLKRGVTGFRCAINPVVQLSFDTPTDPTTHVTKAKIQL